MLLSADAIQMVKDLRAGDLESALPLIDKLYELKDNRVFQLLDHLGNLYVDFQLNAEHLERIVYRSKEEAVFRADESNFRAWKAFSEKVDNLFHYEVSGLPDLNYLSQLQKDLESSKQAKRLEEQPEESMHEGEMESLPNYSSRPMQGISANQIRRMSGKRISRDEL